MTAQLRRTLPPGPLDIIGDVHGELGALERLLDRLGVDPVALTAPRPLVFVGDLVDRGPDSYGVVRLVQRLHAAGLAHCVAGNHELNLLAGQRKEGNQWARSDELERFHMPFEGELISGVFHSKPAPEAKREDMLTFLRELPLLLERDDLRVVHACWWPEAVASLPERGDIATLSKDWQRQIDSKLKADGWIKRRSAELAAAAQLKDPQAPPSVKPEAHVHVTEARQRLNPIRALTSGLERPLRAHERGEFKGGKWRYLRRMEWWREYRERQSVVVGHYWRSRVNAASGTWVTETPTSWAGPLGNVFCVDYSVGRRFAERQVGRSTFQGALAALRWPERTLVFDDQDGELQTTGWGAGDDNSDGR